MNTLRASIFDPDFEPTKWNTVDWWRNPAVKHRFNGDSSEVNPVFQRLLDPIISKSRKIDRVTAVQALIKHKPMLKVREEYGNHQYIVAYNIKGGKLVEYEFCQFFDNKHSSSIERWVGGVFDPEVFSDRLYYEPNQYYLISKKDLKIIKDFYNELQENIK